MSILEKTYQIKTFEEFTSEEQEKIIEKHRDINVDFDDCLYDDAILIDLAENGFNCKWSDLLYDISYCQGSGACFYCNDFNVDKLLKNYECKHKQWLIDIIKNYCYIKIERTNNHYCHENCMTLYIYGTYRLPERIEKYVNDIEGYLEELRHDLSYEIYKNLCNDYEYLTSDEAVKETLIANDYMFNENNYLIEA